MTGAYDMTDRVQRLPDDIYVTVNVTSARPTTLDNTHYRKVRLHVGATATNLSAPEAEELREQLRLAGEFIAELPSSINEDAES
jgi:hypothetical protein